MYNHLTDKELINTIEMNLRSTRLEEELAKRLKEINEQLETIQLEIREKCTHCPERIQNEV